MLQARHYQISLKALASANTLCFITRAWWRETRCIMPDPPQHAFRACLHTPGNMKEKKTEVECASGAARRL
jgi:hypothetical protein